MVLAPDARTTVLSVFGSGSKWSCLARWGGIPLKLAPESTRALMLLHLLIVPGAIILYPLLDLTAMFTMKGITVEDMLRLGAIWASPVVIRCKCWK